jgi:hypothetical protein
MLAGGAELLRVEPHMIGISRHLFEKKSDPRRINLY